MTCEHTDDTNLVDRKSHVCGNCAHAENWRIEGVNRSGELLEVAYCTAAWLTNIYGEQIRPFVFRGCGSKCKRFSAA